MFWDGKGHASILMQGVAPTFFQQDRNQRLPPSCAGVNVHAVSVVRWFIDWRMAVDNERLVIAQVPEKLVPYPKQVAFLLRLDRKTGSNAGMNEDHSIGA